MTKSQSEQGSKETIAARDKAVGPVQRRTSIPVAPPDGTPNAGTRQPAGKSSQCDAVLYGNDPGTRPVSAVRDAQEDVGAAKRAISVQVQGDGGSNSPNGDHHRRNKGTWGVDEPRPGKV